MKKKHIIITSFTLLVFIIVVILFVHYDTLKLNRPKTFNDCMNNISYDDVLFQKEEKYYILIYQKSCKQCKQIEDSVIDKIYYDDAPIYLLSGDNYRNQLVSYDEAGRQRENYYIDKESSNKLYVVMTPTLLLVDKGCVISFFNGVDSIKSELNIT